MWCTTRFSFGTSIIFNVNDLPNITNKCNFTLFADDTTLTFKSHKLNDLEKEINSNMSFNM